MWPPKVPAELIGLQFDVDAVHTGPAAVGEMRWNKGEGCAEIGMPGGVTAQIPLEDLVLIHNDIGPDISNGQFVYLDGTIASKSDMRAGETIAMATMDISTGTTGFATRGGKVRGIDTSHLVAHSTTYLGDNGATIGTKPQFPDTAVEVGMPHTVALLGEFAVRIQSLAYQKGFDVMEQPLGVYSLAESTLTYDYLTRTVSITPTGAFWRYFRRGQELRQAVAVTMSHAATNGVWFFYINGEGAFVFTQDPWDLLTCCPLCAIYYDTIAPAASIPFEERHGAKRNPEWHRGQHNTIGTYYQSGMAASGYTLTGSTDADNSFALASGVISDEDIQSAIAALPDGGPYKILRRMGASGYWTTLASSLPYLSGTYAQYNLNTAGTWSMADITNGEFFNIYVVAVPSFQTDKQIAIVPAQKKHATQALAEAAKIVDEVDWGVGLDAMPFPELAIVHRFTLRGGSGYTTTGKVRIESYKDLRGKTTRISISSGVV